MVEKTDHGLAGQETKKTEKQRQVVAKMIEMYCRGNHRAARGQAVVSREASPAVRLCAECQALLDYAEHRVDKCPLKDTKTFCSSCPVHCYEPSMRERLRTVMRYSGPRMIYVDPPMAIHHLADTLRARHRKATR